MMLVSAKNRFPLRSPPSMESSKTVASVEDEAREDRREVLKTKLSLRTSPEMSPRAEICVTPLRRSTSVRSPLETVLSVMGVISSLAVETAIFASKSTLRSRTSATTESFRGAADIGAEGVVAASGTDARRGIWSFGALSNHTAMKISQALKASSLKCAES